MTTCFLALALLFPTTDADRKSAELGWARGVTSDFLDAAFAGHLEQAEVLTHSSLKEAYAKQGPNRLREWLNSSVATRGFRDHSLGEGRSPDLDEAAFEGTSRDKGRAYRFSLSVTKEAEVGKWRVRYFRFTEGEP